MSEPGAVHTEGQRWRAALRQWGRPAAMLLLLTAALVALHRELRHYRYADIAAAVLAIPPERLALAAVLTLLSYAVLSSYDRMAVAYVGRALPQRRLMLGSAVAYGISQMFGAPELTAGAVRYRFWSAWGLSTTEIAQATSFVASTFLIGVLTVSGFALLLEPAAALAVLRVSAPLARAAAVVPLALVAGYVGWSVARRGQPMRIRGWELPVPTPTLASLQVALGALDWAVAASVLWVLLPAMHALSFVAFIGVFALAQFAGLVSHVPGGLGVFESLMVIWLRPHAAPHLVIAALVAYRAVYYLLPFIGAAALLGAYEARLRGAQLASAASGAAGFVARWAPAVLPSVLSAVTFLAGAVLLSSGATPSVHGRVTRLTEILPLGVVELSHFLASVVGAALLVLAWAIRRRLDAAYGLTVALLALGIVTSLLKGLDYEEALLLGVVLLAVAPSHHAFYRKAALTSEPFTPEWILAVVVVIGASVWLGFFSYRHVEYSGELWWRFAERGDAPRFLRATAGAVALLGIAGLVRLLRHAEVEPRLPSAAELERAARIARESPSSSAQLVLLGDKAVLFAEGDAGFLMYGVEGRSWVALGDPVGSPRATTELAWRFHEEADRHGGWTVFYEVGARTLPVCIDLGLTLLKIGEEARVPLERFSLEGGSRKGLRRAMRDAEKDGARFEMLPTECVNPLLPELRRVSDAWLEAKHTREKGFSLGRFDERYLARFPAAIVRRAGDGRIVAFANVLESGGRDELSVDLMRFTPDAPNGVMDYLFVRLMQWGSVQGYRWFALGIAPLAGFERRRLASRWSRMGAMVYRHGEHFYNFRGLRQYKEKFDPVWEPRYLASPGGLALPRILANVTTLIAGGVGGVVGK